MDGTQTTASDLASVEATLRDALAQGDAVLSAAVPTLRRILAHDDSALINAEIVARVRGMLADLARQIVEGHEACSIDRGALTAALTQDDALLTHLHALAIEGRLADRLEDDAGIDPVLSPLLESLIAGGDEVLAGAAMAVMTAQASFIRQQRDMRLPLGELPRAPFQAALASLHGIAGESEAAAGIGTALQAAFNEDGNRIALLSRLVMRTGSNAAGVLDVKVAGLAVFITALALAAGQDRPTTAMSLSVREPARLILALRAAGLAPAAVRTQSLHFHPDPAPLQGLVDLRADRATQILSASSVRGDR